MFGRRVLLCDCDDATKEYYRAKYGVEDFTPIEVEEVRTLLFFVVFVFCPVLLLLMYDLDSYLRYKLTIALGI